MRVSYYQTVVTSMSLLCGFSRLCPQIYVKLFDRSLVTDQGKLDNCVITYIKVVHINILFVQEIFLETLYHEFIERKHWNFIDGSVINSILKPLVKYPNTKFTILNDTGK